MRMSPIPVLSLLVLSLQGFPGWNVQAENGNSFPGVMTGVVYSADHPDSLASGIFLELRCLDSGKQVHRYETTTDSTGRYIFSGLENTPAVAYVLRIEREESAFFTETLFFTPGSDTLEENPLLVQVSKGETALPAGHPTIPSTMGRPLPDRPLLALFIVLCLVIIYVLLFRIGKGKKDPPRV